MKPASILPFLLLISITTVAQSGNGTLSLTVTGLRSDKGHLLVSLYNGPDGFPDKNDRAVQYARASISHRTSKLEFSHLPYGCYAISLLHDENNNLKMDYGLFNIPKEGFGFSNNAKVVFGPPDFDDAKITFSEVNSKTTIQIKYFSKK
jgi:uncharacterized protein (DUF2141 family)